MGYSTIDDFLLFFFVFVFFRPGCHPVRTNQRPFEWQKDRFLACHAYATENLNESGYLNSISKRKNIRVKHERQIICYGSANNKILYFSHIFRDTFPYQLDFLTPNTWLSADLKDTNCVSFTEEYDHIDTKNGDFPE